MYKLLFVVMIVFSTLHGQNFKMEVIPTISDSSFDIWHKGKVKPPVVKEVVKEQAFYICLFFKDYGLKENKANVKFWVKRTDPDGSVGYTKNKIVGIKKQNDGEVLSKNILRLSFDKDDAPGEYKFEILSLDYYKKKKVKKNFILELKNWQKGSFPATQNDYISWLKQYYRNPTPNASIHAYLQHYQPVTQKGFQIHLLHFHAVIFQKNPHLIPLLLNNFANYTHAEKVKIGTILNYMGQADKLEPLLKGEKDKEILEKTRVKKIDVYGEMTNQFQVNMLWLEFYATSSIDPVAKIIDTFKYLKYSGTAQKYKNNPKGHEQELAKEYIFQLSVLSFRQHYQSYPLVQKYSSYLIEKNGKAKSPSILMLKKLLGK